MLDLRRNIHVGDILNHGSEDAGELCYHVPIPVSNHVQRGMTFPLYRAV